MLSVQSDAHPIGEEAPGGAHVRAPVSVVGPSSIVTSVSVNLVQVVWTMHTGKRGGGGAGGKGGREGGGGGDHGNSGGNSGDGGGQGGGRGGLSGGGSGRRQAVSVAEEHRLPALEIVPPQHAAPPPVRRSHPDPPHTPHDAAQQVRPFKMPSEQRAACSRRREAAALLQRLPACCTAGSRYRTTSTRAIPSLSVVQVQRVTGVRVVQLWLPAVQHRAPRFGAERAAGGLVASHPRQPGRGVRESSPSKSLYQVGPPVALGEAVTPSERDGSTSTDCED